MKESLTIIDYEDQEIFYTEIYRQLKKHYESNEKPPKHLMLGRHEFKILGKVSKSMGVIAEHGMIYMGMEVWHMQGYDRLLLVGNINQLLNNEI